MSTQAEQEQGRRNRLEALIDTGRWKSVDELLDLEDELEMWLQVVLEEDRFTEKEIDQITRKAVAFFVLSILPLRRQNLFLIYLERPLQIREVLVETTS